MMAASKKKSEAARLVKRYARNWQSDTSVLFFYWPKQSRSLSDSRGWRNELQLLMGNVIKSHCRRACRMEVIVEAIFENYSLIQSVGKFSGFILDVHLSKMYSI